MFTIVSLLPSKKSNINCYLTVLLLFLSSYSSHWLSRTRYHDQLAHCRRRQPSPPPPPYQRRRWNCTPRSSTRSFGLGGRDGGEYPISSRTSLPTASRRPSTVWSSFGVDPAGRNAPCSGRRRHTRSQFTVLSVSSCQWRATAAGLSIRRRRTAARTTRRTASCSFNSPFCFRAFVLSAF